MPGLPSDADTHICLGDVLNKWDERWASGIYLGNRVISQEAYVATDAGIIKCRAIRRRPEEQP